MKKPRFLFEQDLNPLQHHRVNNSPRFCNLLLFCQGYVIMLLFGRNVAWTYEGPDAWFHGNVKTGYLVPWLGLGAAVELGWVPLLSPVAAALSPHLWLGLALAAAWTLLTSEDLGLFAGPPSPSSAVSKDE